MNGRRWRSWVVVASLLAAPVALQATVAPAGAASKKPVVSSIAPATGPTSGGTTVTLTGKRFTAKSVVLFGAKRAASTTYRSKSRLVAVAPPGAAGRVAVRVRTAKGTSAVRAKASFRYVAPARPPVIVPAPSLTTLAPDEGLLLGGETVRLTGTGFTPGAVVLFGGTPATVVTYQSPTLLLARAPMGDAGLVPVTVTTAGGTSAQQVRYRYAETVIVSRRAEALADGNASTGSLSADGRYVAFQSSARNLDGDHGTSSQIYVADRIAGTVELVSRTLTGGAPASGSVLLQLSADGRHVAFVSGATDLVAGDTNGVSDVFVRDRVTGTTSLASVSSTGVQVDHTANAGAISGDGRFVAFATAAALVAEDTNGTDDIYRRDMVAGTTRLVSATPAGVAATTPPSVPRSPPTAAMSPTTAAPPT